MKRIQTRATTLLAAAAIFALNLYLCWGLFGIEYLRFMGSVEGCFIGLARYTRDHWNDLTWFPLWHLGMPYANVYPPLLPWGVAFTSAISGMSIAHAFHWVAALTYCLGPVALYALALRLTRSPWTAFAAAALYSTVSWSAFLFPEIATDLGSHLHPRRLQAYLEYGETPHIASLTLLPLALLFWDLAIERRRAWLVALAAISAASVVLTSWLGGLSLALMIASLAIARVPSRRDLLTMSSVAIAAYCLAMPWTAPSVIAATQFNSKTLGGDFRLTYLTLPKWLLAATAVLFLLKFAARKLTRELQFAIFFVFLIASIVFPFAWRGISAVPQPTRYHLELEMAISLLIPIAAAGFLKSRPAIAGITIALLCLALVFPLRASRRYARDVLIRPIDITTTTEWKLAQWLNHEWTGGRVMMTGSVAYWLTAFSDVPQKNGGTEQGVVAYAARLAEYGIYYGAPYASGHNGEFSVLWLKALGTQAVGVSGPASGEQYHPFLDPHQFDGLLPPVYESAGDTIYRVRTRPTSLAHVVPEQSLVARMPENGIDVDPLRPYVAALENSALPDAQFQWTSLHSAHITADLAPDQVLSVQIPWHKGWHSSFPIQHSSFPIQRDALGLMYLKPARSGHLEFDLTFDGGLEAQIARFLSAATALLLIAATLLDLRRA